MDMDKTQWKKLRAMMMFSWQLVYSTRTCFDMNTKDCDMFGNRSGGHS